MLKNDYSQAELDQGVDTFINELIQLRQSETMLMYLDQNSDQILANAIQTYTQQMGAQAEILILNPELPLDGQARQLAERIRQGGFDAICELSEQYFYHTQGWKEAREVGARCYSIAGLDAAAFIRCVGKVDHQVMFQFGMALRQVLHGSRSLRIHTKKGTDLRMQIKLNLLQRLIAKYGNRPRSFIMPPCGLLNAHTQATFLGGQVAFLGVPTSIEGTAVIDGYLWPPATIGLLDTPLVLRIEKGMVVEIGGCPTKSKILTRWFEGQSISIPHFCIGFNPGASLSGKILEAERAFGCISLGMGQGAYHTDGIIGSPSMETDGKIIEDNGSFVIDPLVSLEKKMIRHA
jgi:leucyl aminopeptidase (aminopeptidase T)